MIATDPKSAAVVGATRLDAQLRGLAQPNYVGVPPVPLHAILELGVAARCFDDHAQVDVAFAYLDEVYAWRQLRCGIRGRVGAHRQITGQDFGKLPPGSTRARDDHERAGGAKTRDNAGPRIQSEIYGDSIAEGHASGPPASGVSVYWHRHCAAIDSRFRRQGL